MASSALRPHLPHRLPNPLLVLLLLALLACAGRDPGETDGSAADTAADASPAAPAEAAAPWAPAPDRRGGALARSPHDDALYIADGDHQALRVVALPLNRAPAAEVALPGRPAQVLALSDRVLVTIREPGLLLSLVHQDGQLVIRQRVPLPADAWGLAVTPDERSALVTSAWSRAVSFVDLAAGEVRWSRPVAREPRGVVVMPGGDRAYLSHLVGSGLTRIDGLHGDKPVVRRVALPAGRLSQPLSGEALNASLGYAPVLSPDGSRLFVPRHALGGLGWQPWFGRPVVDVLLTAGDTPLAPARDHRGVSATPKRSDDHQIDDGGEAPALPLHWIVQPRASAYRNSTNTLLVLSEGHGRLTELDARALDPSLHPKARYELSHQGDDSDRCGAPSGVALSHDETEAFVWCRTTGELARVPLKPETYAAGPDGDPDPPSFLSLAGAPLPEPAASGRRLFYDARSDAEHNRGVSGGLACSGCHPDGRDDGHVWFDRHGGLHAALTTRTEITYPNDEYTERVLVVGKPRQTPMLAGRIDADSAYGWQGESDTLVDRIRHGFAIHRWDGFGRHSSSAFYRAAHDGQAGALAAFLRDGLVPPTSEPRLLTDQERRGQSLFQSPRTQCSSCHAAQDDYSNRATHTLPLSRSTLGESEAPRFRVPSLLYVGGTAPYLHDGSQPSLGPLLDAIGHDMGSTADLTAAERADLAAYLATIGTVTGEPAPPAARAQPQPWPFASTNPASQHSAAPASSPAAPEDDTIDPWPRSHTPAPSRKAWEAAPPIQLRHMPDGCRAWRVREWVRLQCIPGVKQKYFWGGDVRTQPVFRVALLAGDREDLSLRIEHRTGYATEGVAIFPLRPGQRRFIEIDRAITRQVICSRYADWIMAATFTISASWIGDQPDLVVSRYGRHPSTGVRTVVEHCGW